MASSKLAKVKNKSAGGRGQQIGDNGKTGSGMQQPMASGGAKTSSLQKRGAGNKRIAGGGGSGY